MHTKQGMPTPPDSEATGVSETSTSVRSGGSLGFADSSGGCGLGTGQDADDGTVKHSSTPLGWFGDLLEFPKQLVTQCTSARPGTMSTCELENVRGCGVGMLLVDCENPTYNNYNVTVRSLSAGGPAHISQQIQIGDKILRIDGKDVVGMRTSDLGSLLIGPVGSAVSLQVS